MHEYRDCDECACNPICRSKYPKLGNLVGAVNCNNFVPKVKQEWISVKDRLPERTLPPHDVLVYHDLNCGMFVDRAWYSYDMGKWCSVLGMKLKVTHWMPLPEPPKEEEENG